MKCSTAAYNPCPTTPDAQCVIYTGGNLTNINVTTNMRLDEILETLNNVINTLDFDLFTEDTVTLDISGDGTSINPLSGDVNVSDFGNNAVLILEDGLYVPNTIQNGVVMGGIVTWLQDYDYHVSPAVYYINGAKFDQRDDFPGGFDFTLTPPDGVYNRIDTFIVDAYGLTSVLEGTPSVDPAVAPIDTEIQLPLSIALVETGTTEPTIAVECLYQNNNESPLWVNTTSNAVKINPNSTLTPCNGTKSIEGTTVATGDNILFTRSSNFVPGASHSLLTFLIRSKGFSGNNNFMRLQWEFNGSPVGTSVALRNLAFGFNGLDTSACQVVSIPFSFFGITAVSIVNSFRMTGSVAAPGGIGFFIDDLCLQGQPIPTTPNTADEKVKVSSNDTTAGYLNGKLVAGTGITLVENNNGANETLTINSTASSALSANNGLTENVADNVQLGGTLIQDTVIANGAFQLDVTGSNANYVFGVDNNTAGTAGDFHSTGGVAVLGTGVNGGVFNGSTYGVQGITATDGAIPALFSGTYSSTNTQEKILTVQRYTSGTAGINMGGYISYDLETSTGATAQAARLVTYWEDPTNGSVDSAFAIYNVANSVTGRKLNLASTGQLSLDEYGSGTFTGTPTYILAVDASGNVIETSTGSATFVTADNGLIISSANNVQLGNSSIASDAIGGAPLIRNTAINSASYNMVIGGNKSFTAEAHNPILRIVNRYTGVDQSEALMLETKSAASTSLVVDSAGGGAVILGTSLGIYVESTDASTNAGQFATTGTNSTTLLVSATGGGANARILTGYIYGDNHNDVVTAITINRETLSASAPDDGIGVAINLQNATDVSSADLTNRIISKWTDATYATRTSEFSIWGLNAGATEQQLTIKGTGQLQLNQYGTATFTGTPAYILAVDSSGNVIETTASGSTAITADNGLTANTSTNVRLGGTLLQNTSINGTGSYYLTMTSSIINATNTGSLIAINSGAGQAFYAESGAGNAIRAVSTSALGVLGISTSGVGVGGNSTSGNGIQGYSIDGRGGLLTSEPASTNTIVTVARLSRLTTGTAANGIGGALEFFTETDSNGDISTKLTSKWTTAANATRTSEFIISGVNSAVTADLLTISGNGATKLNKYGLGTITGTPAYALNVDASGNIIEAAIGAGMTNPMSAEGDIIISDDGAGTPKRLAAGAAGFVLTSNGAGTEPSWQAAGGAAGITRTITSTSSPLTMGSAALTDYVYIVTGTTTVTLPTAVGNTNRYTVLCNDNTLTTTIATTGGQTINGSSTQTLTSRYESVDLVSNNSNWFII